MRQCKHLFLDPERAGGQGGDRVGVCKPLPAKGPHSWGIAAIIDSGLIHLHIYICHKKEMQDPFFSRLCCLGPCRRVCGGCVPRTGPHWCPCALTRGHPTAPTRFSICISFPLPCLTGGDRKTDREKHLRGGEKPICFGFPVTPSLGSAQVV